MEDKFDVMGNKMNQVNRNVEAMKQKFEVLSMQEKYVDEKLDTVASKVKEKLHSMEIRMNGKLDDTRLVERQQLATLDSKLSNAETTLKNRLSRNFFLLFNVVIIPIVRVILGVLIARGGR
jgi:hypothetical protein